MPADSFSDVIRPSGLARPQDVDNMLVHLCSIHSSSGPSALLRCGCSSPSTCIATRTRLAQAANYAACASPIHPTQLFQVYYETQIAPDTVSIIG